MGKHKEILENVAKVVKDIMNEREYASIDAATKK